MLPTIWSVPATAIIMAPIATLPKPNVPRLAFPPLAQHAPIVVRLKKVNLVCANVLGPKVDGVFLHKPSHHAHAIQTPRKNLCMQALHANTVVPLIAMPTVHLITMPMEPTAVFVTLTLLDLRVCCRETLVIIGETLHTREDWLDVFVTPPIQINLLDPVANTLAPTNAMVTAIQTVKAIALVIPSMQVVIVNIPEQTIAATMVCHKTMVRVCVILGFSERRVGTLATTNATPTAIQTIKVIALVIPSMQVLRVCCREKAIAATMVCHKTMVRVCVILGFSERRVGTLDPIAKTMVCQTTMVCALVIPIMQGTSASSRDPIAATMVCQTTMVCASVTRCSRRGRVMRSRVATVKMSSDRCSGRTLRPSTPTCPSA